MPQEPNQIQGLQPCPDHQKIPIIGEIPIIPQTLDPSAIDPELEKWIAACPATYLLRKYKAEGAELPRFRVGQAYSEEIDEYGRTPWNRLRVRMEISPARYGLEKTEEEIGECECPTPCPGPSRNGNPDVFYCVNCKKLFGRDRLNIVPEEERL